MSTDTLKRFREQALRVSGAESKKHQRDLREKMRADAVALIALASEIVSRSTTTKRLEQLLDEIRAAADDVRASSEAYIAAVLALADEAARIWDSMLVAALSKAAIDRDKQTKMLRSVLDDAEQALREALRSAREDAHMFERPLARLDELESRTAEFPLWARECLARWEMLDRPAPTLDPERIARAQAAYTRGDHEDLDNVLSRVQAGGPWLTE